MNRTRVKICGITRAEDALVAVEAGADALGFVFASSPRRVSVEQAAELAAHVAPLVSIVGVFVDADPEFVERAVHECGLSAVQYCGGETPRACATAPVPVIKALRVGPDFTWSVTEPYRDATAAILLDAYRPGVAGGTGEAFEWSVASRRPNRLRLIAAGGLNPANVGEAITTMRPYAVDVSTGVESAPGLKDHDKIRAFCAAVRAADEEVAGR